MKRLEASAESSPRRDQLQEMWVKVGGTLRERGNTGGRDKTEAIRLEQFENHTEWGQDHQEALSKRCGNFSIVELPDASEIPFSEVQTNFFPRLSHS